MNFPPRQAKISVRLKVTVDDSGGYERFCQMISLLFFSIPCSLSACSSYTTYRGQTIRTIFNTKKVCATVEHCFFHDLSTNYGGGIYFKASEGDLAVHTTTFLNTNTEQTWPYCGYGGAIAHDGDSLAITLSCFRNTSSDGYGTAIHFSSGNGFKQIASTSFYECFNSDSDAEGTISDDNTGETGYSYNNFTECRLNTDSELWGDGACLYSDGTTGIILFTYCTVVNCVGENAICTYVKTPPEIHFCNFYWNAVTDWPFLYAQTCGMDVEYCIFNGPGTIAQLHSSSAQGYRFDYCVFSGAGPDAAVISSQAGNQVYSVTASRYITHSHTFYCPTASPTRSQSPTRTGSFVATGTKAATAIVPTESPLPSETDSVTETPMATVSHSPTATVSQTWYCDVYSGLTAHLTADNVFCVEVHSSLFVGTTAGYGGGICVWAGSATAVIDGSTFYETSATYGGGFDYSGSDLKVSICCFRSTSATTEGTGISITGGSGLAFVREVTLAGCENSEEEASGTICVSAEVQCSISHLNVSGCSLIHSAESTSSGEGAILEIRQAPTSWNLSLATIVKNAGFSGIWSRSVDPSEVKLSNFYGNEFSADSGVISCESVGVSVTDCVFNGNSNEIFLEITEDATGFQLSGCVFSGILPVGPYYLVTENNEINAETATYFIPYLDTELCPAAPYVPTPLATAKPTASPYPGTPPVTPVVTSTQSPALTPPQTEPQTPARTPPESPAQSPAETDAQTEAPASATQSPPDQTAAPPTASSSDAPPNPPAPDGGAGQSGGALSPAILGAAAGGAAILIGAVVLAVVLCRRRPAGPSGLLSDDAPTTTELGPGIAELTETEIGDHDYLNPITVAADGAPFQTEVNDDD
jgi:hypothetical protein